MASKSSKVKGKHQGKLSKPTPNQYGEKKRIFGFSQKRPYFGVAWRKLKKTTQNGLQKLQESFWYALNV